MPANPMQRKARNSFLLGMIVTLLVCAIVGGLAYFLISNKNKNKNEEEGTLTFAYRLKKDIKALNEIKSSDVEAITISSKVVPTGSFASKTKTTNSKGKEEWKDKAFPGGKYAKIDLKAGTILGEALVVDVNTSNLQKKEDGTIEYLDDVRRVEYNMLTLPTEVTEGDFVDIRVTFPNGQNLIVVPKKEIKTILGNTVGFDMTEGEIEVMESAIVESYIIKASKLYVTQYVDAGTQEKSAKTYMPTEEVRKIMEANPDIKQSAIKSYNAGIRSYIQDERNNYEAEAQQNIEAGIQAEIENAKKAREAYLNGLTSY